MRYALLGPTDDGSEKGIPNPKSTAELKVRAEGRLTELSHTRAGLRLWRTLLLGATFGIPLIAWPLLVEDPAHRVLLAGIFGFSEAFFVLTFLFTRAKLQELNADLQVVEFDTVLISLSDLRQRTAADLFFKHQLELKRYYDLTLRQHRQAFVLGVVCVLFGLGVVAGAAALVTAGTASSTSAKVITGSLGAVGALLAGFVAQVYLGIYRGSSNSLGAFHGRLVETNHLHFANLLISGIRNEDERSETLKQLALKTPLAQHEPEAG